EEGEEKPEADAGTPRVPDRPRGATSHARFSAASQPAAQKGPAARRRPRAAREAYSLYVPLGRGASPPFRTLPPGRTASRRTSRGWGPAVRGERSGSPSRRTATGWAPCVRGEQSEIAPAKPALESGTLPRREASNE